MNKNQKRSRKYSTTIRKYNTDTVEKDTLYYINNKGGFSKKEKLQVKLNGITVETYLKLYDDLKVDVAKAKSYLNNSNQALTAFLISKGLITPNVNLNALIEDLEELLVIIPNEPYDLLQINGEGYITSQTNINGHIINHLEEYPEDLLYGYYRLVDNKLVIDEDKKLEYYAGGL